MDIPKIICQPKDKLLSLNILLRVPAKTARSSSCNGSSNRYFLPYCNILYIQYVKQMKEKRGERMARTWRDARKRRG